MEPEPHLTVLPQYYICGLVRAKGFLPRVAIRLHAVHGALGGGRRRGPWRGFDDVEFATLEWVAWFNTQRLLEALGYVPPAEYEAQYHETQTAQMGVEGFN